MRNNLEGLEARQIQHWEGVMFMPLIQTLTGTFTMDFNMPPVLHLDPGGAGRTVLLPAEVKGGLFLIRNAADAAEALTVKEDANVTTIAVLSQGQAAWFYCDGVTWYAFAGISGTGNITEAVSAGVVLARGQHTTVTASDTVVTGLATVVSVVANLDDAPVIGADRATASIGDQAGTPAAGSILVRSWKPTASGDATPIAATTFTKKVNWIAAGTLAA